MRDDDSIPEATSSNRRSLTRRSVLATSAATLASVGLAGCSGGSGGEDREPTDGGTGEGGATPGWMTTTLEDVRTGETFTIAELEKPVLVQTFAVWCSKCDRQETEIANYREQNDDFRMVSLNIDQNEDAAKVRDHANSQGYDWRWTISSTGLSRSLVEEFGAGITHAPNTPLVFVCSNTEYRRLSNGIKGPSQLQSAFDDGC